MDEDEEYSIEDDEAGSRRRASSAMITVLRSLEEDEEACCAQFCRTHMMRQMLFLTVGTVTVVLGAFGAASWHIEPHCESRAQQAKLCCFL